MKTVRVRRKLVVLIAALTLAACESITGTERVRMTGAWSTTADDILFTAQEDDDGTFVGSGTILYGSGRTYPMEVRGVNAHPNVSFTIVDSRNLALNFQGEFLSANLLSGTVTGYSDGSARRNFARN